VGRDVAFVALNELGHAEDRTDLRSIVGSEVAIGTCGDKWTHQDADAAKAECIVQDVPIGH
jgi:hypothetical protein